MTIKRISRVPTGSIAVTYGREPPDSTRSSFGSPWVGCITPPEVRNIEVRIGGLMNYITRQTEISVPPLLWSWRSRLEFTVMFLFDSRFIAYQLANVDSWGFICFGENPKPLSLLSSRHMFWNSVFDDSLSQLPAVYHTCSRSLGLHKCPRRHRCSSFLLPECYILNCGCCKGYCNCPRCECCDGYCSCAKARAQSPEWIKLMDEHLSSFTQNPRKELLSCVTDRHILKTSSTARGFFHAGDYHPNPGVFARPVIENEINGDWMIEETQEVLPADQILLS